MNGIGHGIRAAAVLSLLCSCAKPSDDRPVLTQEAFFAAAKKCDALDPVFKLELQGKLPSFSFQERATHDTTAQCLADALKRYRFQSMEIRVTSREATSP